MFYSRAAGSDVLTNRFVLYSYSLVQFFNKMKKWSDMANLSGEMRQKIEHLERNFNVSTVIFKKYKPIFLYVFKDTTSNEPPKQAKNRKQR